MGTKGSIFMMQGDNFATEPCGIVEVTMWLCALLKQQYYVVLVLGNEGGGFHHMQGHHTRAQGLVQGS